MKNYKILRVINLYEEIFLDFIKKQKIDNFSYKEIIKKFKFQSYNYLNSFEEEMIKQNNQAELIIYNFELLQDKWIFENGKKNNEYKSKEEKFFNIFCMQLKFIRPEILFFQHSTPFDLKQLKYLKDNFSFIKKIIFHNGIIIKNKDLKYVDYIFSALPQLKLFYNNEGIKSDLVYHYFDENILKNITKNKTYENDLLFVGKSGNLKDLNHIKRFNFLKKILENDDIIFKCYSLEKDRHDKIQLLNIKTLIRNLILKIISKFPNFIIIYLQNKKIKNEKIKNIFKDVSKKKDKTNIYLHKIFKGKIKNSIYGIDMFKEINKSKITFNIHTNESNNECGNIRMFESTGIGSCLLTDYKKNIVDLFIPDEEILTYKDYHEFYSKYCEVISNQKLLDEIRLKGQKKTLREHSTKVRVDQMNNLINKILN
ncbi:glycosyltransferase [Candidatus Pelagibacter sp.]|nr:glycosyltransferase [Candidatus Pelagibacter sp.]